MTREEEVMKAARVYANGIAQHLPNKKYCEEDFIAGAKWADSSMLAKACEWLRNNWHKYINIDADGVVCFGHWENDFRKAMEGE